MSLLQAMPAAASISRPAGVRACLSVNRQENGAARKVFFRSVLLVPLASFALLAAPNPAEANIIPSGWSFPSLPTPEERLKIHEGVVKTYSDFDANSKNSALVQDILKRSKENASKNKKLMQNKYCERQAEWGIGDCSLEFSTPEEKAKFLELLRKERAALQ